MVFKITYRKLYKYLLLYNSNKMDAKMTNEEDMNRLEIEASIENRFRKAISAGKLPSCSKCGMFYVGGLPLHEDSRWVDQGSPGDLYSEWKKLYEGDIVTQDEHGELLCRRCSPDMPRESYDGENRRKEK